MATFERFQAEMGEETRYTITITNSERIFATRALSEAISHHKERLIEKVRAADMMSAQLLLEEIDTYTELVRVMRECIKAVVEA